MSKLILPRRNFLLGAASLLAAPAVIRVAKLMPVRLIPLTTTFNWGSYTNDFDPSAMIAYGFGGYLLVAEKDKNGTIHVFRKSVEPREIRKMLAAGSDA